MEDAGRLGWQERSWGYEIHRVDRGLRLTDRGSWGLAYGAFVAGGVGLALFVGGLIALGSSSGLDTAIGAPAVLGSAVLLLAIAGVLYRVYRRRADRAEAT